MKNAEISTYADIDWLTLWKNERKRKSWNSKKAKDWDKKAGSFAERTAESPYIPLFLSRLPLEPSSTVLDVGCGPGTLALPLAEMTAQVTAIDYSQKMLDITADRATQKNLTNLSCIHCSWEDDWHEYGIEPADIAIASRSMNVADLPAAITKLDQFSKRFVFLSDRIAPSPFDPDAFAAIGREFNSGPDYIFTLNFLYTMNIHANVEILELDRHVHYKDRNEALRSYSWMFKELQDDELKKLEKFIESRIVYSSDERIILRRNHPPRWAMIWWKKGTEGEII